MGSIEYRVRVLNIKREKRIQLFLRVLKVETKQKLENSGGKRVSASTRF